jgi:hypothetical protein
VSYAWRQRGEGGSQRRTSMTCSISGSTSSRAAVLERESHRVGPKLAGWPKDFDYKSLRTASSWPNVWANPVTFTLWRATPPTHREPLVAIAIDAENPGPVPGQICTMGSDESSGWRGTCTRLWMPSCS